MSLSRGCVLVLRSNMGVFGLGAHRFTRHPPIPLCAISARERVITSPCFPSPITYLFPPVPSPLSQTPRKIELTNQTVGSPSSTYTRRSTRMASSTETSHSATSSAVPLPLPPSPPPPCTQPLSPPPPPPPPAVLPRDRRSCSSISRARPTRVGWSGCR